MRKLVCARNIVLELEKKIKYDLKSTSQLSTAWEDNVGAENLPNGKDPLISSRTKYIFIKYHWFRSKKSYQD